MKLLNLMIDPGLLTLKYEFIEEYSSKYFHKEDL